MTEFAPRKDLDILLGVQDLSVTVRSVNTEIPLVSNLDFNITRSSSLGIAGESGCGKSLMLKSILKLVPANIHVKGILKFYPDTSEESDRYDLAENEVSKLRGSEIGFMFQEPASSFSPVRRCGLQVLDALPDDVRKDKNGAKNRVCELLELSGLENPARIYGSYPHELSGGMLQRVALAAALAGNPKLLFADEPTTALDAPKRREILETLTKLKEKLGLSLVIVSHDLGMLRESTDMLIIMYCGQIVESGSTEAVLSAPAHPYTAKLLGSAESYHTGAAPEPIKGEIPPLSNPPAGCRFRPRCDFADDECLAEPVLSAAPHNGEVRCFHPII